MAKNARNEKRKLTAALVNGVALALVTAGLIVPVSQAAQGWEAWPLYPTVLICAGALHLLARRVVHEVED